MKYRGLQQSNCYHTLPEAGGRPGPCAGSFLRAALYALAVFFAAPHAASAQAVLTDDAQTSTAPKALDANFGTNPNLNVSSSSGVYVKFKLSSTLPAGTPGAAVERATLKLYLANVTTAGRLDVYAVTGAWDEATLTARSAPPLGSLLTTTSQIGTDRRGKFLVVDVTPFVRQWLGDDGLGANGAPNHGLALVAHAAASEVANITFDSKENSQTSHEPQLLIQLRAAAGQQSPQGEPGPAGPPGPKGLNWQGAWDAARSYVVDDAVSYEGSSWRAVRDNTNVAPAEGADWAIVARKGDDVSGGTVTEVSAAGPLSVTNATTTPNISLGVVPAANGGTGLSSPGAAGSFLRSDGGSWASGPLAASDIPAGSGSYIQNTTSQQESSNFNINGNGKADIFDAATQYSIGGSRVLSNAGANNLFAGVGAGAANAGQGNAFYGSGAGFVNLNGDFNSFFGGGAGRANTDGDNNSFYGSSAGLSNTTGFQNSFFGREAGRGNTTGSFNSFFGRSTGLSNTTGEANSFFGQDAGVLNTTGSLNAFFGNSSGQANTAGRGNTFFGVGAGSGNTTGSNNTAIGVGANVGAADLTFAAAIGAGAVVTTSNTIVLGRPSETVQVPGALNVAGTFGASTLDAATQYNIAGNRVLSMAGSFNLIAGANAGASITSGHSNAFFGRAAGNQTTTGSANSFFGRDAGLGNVGGSANSFFGFEAGKVNTAGFNSFFGHQAGLSNTVAIRNSFFGALAGLNTTTGGSNSFFGIEAGKLNTDGGFNSFFGDGAGVSNTSSNNSFFGFRSGLNNTGGYSNSFFGSGAGGNNTTGSDNTFVGYAADFDVSNATGDSVTLIGTRARAASVLSNATAVGSDAKVTSSNSLVLGSISGVNGAGASTNVGIGTTAPRARLHVTGGKVYVEANGQGVVLKSPAGACFELTVTNAGALAVAAMAACP